LKLTETIDYENQTCLLDQTEENKIIQQQVSLPPIPPTSFSGRKVTKHGEDTKIPQDQLKILWNDYKNSAAWRKLQEKLLWKDYVERCTPEKLVPLKYAPPIKAEQLRERDKNSLLLLTGASSNHYMCLRQLLRSIQKHEPKTSVVVYDLGLDANEREELLKVHNVSLKTFPFSSYPEHFNMNHYNGSYAWKPTLICNENKTHRKVMWLDAGDVLTKNLDDVRKALKKNGVMITQVDKLVSKWTADKTFINLGLNRSNFETTRMVRAGIVAFDRENSKSNSIIDSWAKAAFDRNCISPDDASLLNHRFDMSLLTLTVASKHPTHFNNLEVINHGITVHNDNITQSKSRFKDFLKNTELTKKA
jgi:hypothetical protein